MVASINRQILIDVKVSGQQAVASLKKIDKNTKNVAKSVRALRGNMLGFGLSFLFTGMAINRFASGALKALINTSKIAGAETSRFNVLTQQLAGSWEFMKFTFTDALGQSELFATLIGWIIKLTDRFAEMSEGKKAFIGISLAGTAVVVTLMQIIGQTALAVLGFKALKELGWIASLGKGIMWLSGFIYRLGVLLVTLPGKILAVSRAFLMNPITLWIGAIAALIGFMVLLSYKFGGLGNALKAMVSTVIVAAGIFADIIVGAIVVPIQWIAVAIARVMDLAGHRPPGWLAEFVQWQPSIAVNAAELAMKIQPDAVRSNAEVMADIKSDLKSFLNDLVPVMGEAVRVGAQEGMSSGVVPTPSM